MAELDSLLGCKISLISHQDIRYDGTLFSINQAESSIVLKDVKAFGTEDRVTDKSKVVPPSSSTLPFVTFPGQEIKDLYVHESAAAPTPAPAAPEQKPKQETKPKPHKEHTNPPAAPAQEKETKAATQPPKTHNKEKDNNNKEATVNKEKAAAASGSHSGVGTGSHLLKLREKKAGDAGAAKVDANSEFDFQEGLKGFNKDEVLAEVADNNTKKYVKDDFFDNFTNGNTEDGKKTRMSASEERQLNQDTFGAIALTNQYRRGGRGRGGRGSGGGRGNGGRSSGRGGNGRGRGGGRNSNNNNNA